MFILGERRIEMKEVLWSSNAQADVLSCDFCSQLGLDRIMLQKENVSYYYSLRIIVPLAASRMESRIEDYVFKPGNFHRPKDSKEKFGEILGEQVDIVLNKLEALGYKFSDASIEAEEMKNELDVFITISRGCEIEYGKNGKEKKIIKVISIIPSGPGFRKNLENVCEIIEKLKMEKGQNNEILEPSIENMNMTLDEILWFVVKGISTSSKNKVETRDEVEKLLEVGNLYDEEVIHIGSKKKNQKEVSMERKYLRPKWLIYTEKINNEWNIREFHSGTEVQNELKKVWKRKTTRRSIAFHDMRPVQYSVFAKTDVGYARIKNHDACNYKSIQVFWDKKNL